MSERRGLVEWEGEEFPLSRQARLLGLHRSGLYYQPRPPSAAEVAFLLKNITASYPNHVWGIDITYIRLRGGWLYLVAILDWYSRYVVSWQLDDTLEMPFVLAAVDQALAQATPAICNSDQSLP